MRRGPLFLVAGGAFVLMYASASAVPLTNSGGPREDALALLEQAAKAVRELSYHGTQMVSFWSENGSSSALIDVTHVRGQGLLLSVAPTPQNPGGAVYDDESGEVPEVVSFGNGTLSLLQRHYQVAVEGSGEVAGRQAYVVAVRRPGAAPTARFWVDQQTRLPLRREVLDNQGRTLRESAFLHLTLGASRVVAGARSAASKMPVTHGAPADVATLRANGWQVPDLTGLDLVGARITGTGDDETLHVTYSDGLSTVSLFEQKGDLDETSLEGWRRAEFAGEQVWMQDAFPRRMVWAGDGMVFTVLCDCPSAYLEAVVRALPHGTPGPAMTARLGNGLERVASWFNPFS